MNHKPTNKHLEKTNNQKFPQLTPLKLEQLEKVAGGPTGGPDDPGDDYPNN